MNLDSKGSSKTNTDLKSILTIYIKQWRWFLLSGVVGLIFAFLKIRYTTPEYLVTAQIQIIQDKNSTNELSVFQDLGIQSAASQMIEDEIEILSSRANFIDVVKELGINTKISSIGNIIDSELYKAPPFNINFIAKDSVIQNAKFYFFIEFSSNTTFKYSEEEDIPFKSFSFGKSIPSAIGDIVITPTMINPASYSNRRYKVEISPVGEVAQAYNSIVEIGVSQELSNILNISLNSSIPDKAKDIVNKLIEVYNRNAIQNKKSIADKTSDFINNRIKLISGTLSSVDEDAQELLTQKGMTGSGLEVGAAVQVSASSRQNLENAKIQLEMVSGMKDYVQQESGYEEMPVVDLGNNAIAQTTAQYNQLVAERKRLLKSADSKNPMIVNLDQQLDGLKSTVQSSLNALERNVGMNVSTLQNQMGRIQGTIYSAPENQREFRNITRKQETTESLYLYLLQKREESQITYASASPKSNVIDDAYLANPMPVAPKKNIIYLTYLMLGLMLPFSIIYANTLFDTKIHNMHALGEITKDIPVLGEVPKLNKKDYKIILKDDRSILAEALRILRTNLDYLIKTKSTESNKNNVIFVTSSVPGEGKTFISTNLSTILAGNKKKVLLIGADIRNPKLFSFFKGKNIDELKTPQRNKDAGLTEYLYGDSLEFSDIVHEMLINENIVDVIYSGRIPPNPSELLMSERVNDLLLEASEKYDYVIVDTAPLMVVSDTLLISEYANHILYVTRAGVTEKKAIEFPLKLQQEGKIKGLAFVVNDVNVDNLGYGGKYGYGYGKRNKKWWKF